MEGRVVRFTSLIAPHILLYGYSETPQSILTSLLCDHCVATFPSSTHPGIDGTVNTNDAFLGIDSDNLDVHGGPIKVFPPAFDAGEELREKLREKLRERKRERSLLSWWTLFLCFAVLGSAV